MSNWKIKHVVSTTSINLYGDSLYETETNLNDCLGRVNDLTGSGWELVSVTSLIYDGSASALLYTLRTPIGS